MFIFDASRFERFSESLDFFSKRQTLFGNDIHQVIYTQWFGARHQ